MNQLFSGGAICDLILALMLLESLALAAYRWRTGRGLSPAAILPSFAAGAFLLLALRAALVDAGLGWVELSLGAALLAHFFDLYQRALR